MIEMRIEIGEKNTMHLVIFAFWNCLATAIPRNLAFLRVPNRAQTVG
jgi:hypothetical protein